MANDNNVLEIIKIKYSAVTTLQLVGKKQPNIFYKRYIFRFARSALSVFISKNIRIQGEWCCTWTNSFRFYGLNNPWAFETCTNGRTVFPVFNSVRKPTTGLTIGLLEGNLDSTPHPLLWNKTKLAGMTALCNRHIKAMWDI